ncbi:MAG: ionic transporter y4hA [Cyclobacteriaceae bacterium]|jgi:Ca2+:H+ antiporter|nr:ionic transporter y4hA [Cyclobacteriaceae bacterium]
MSLPMNPRFWSVLKALAIPLLAWAAFFLKHTFDSGLLLLVAVVALFAAVMNAVHHAEIISHRVGEPFGALVLAISVTVIEVSIILSFMLTGQAESTFLARDTVFAAVMIILTGMTGLTLFIGGLRFREQEFLSTGVTSALIVLVTISVMVLILPNYTQTREGPFYSTAQLVFVSVITLLLYGSFLFVQNVRHRADYVLPQEATDGVRPSAQQTTLSALLLPVSLLAVVMLAESMAADLDHAIEAVGAPVALSGIVIACVVLLPEGISAVKAALNNQLQKSLILSLGSALASISLTIPAVSFFAVATGRQVAFGIDAESTVVFLLSLFVIVLSLSKGKTTILQGLVLLLLFAVYLFLTIVP